MGRRRFSAWLALSLALALALAALVSPALASGAASPQLGTPTAPSPLSSEALSERAPFNQSAHYPLGLRPDPALYRPHADWLGRLILPSEQELAQAPDAPGEDWVWIELEQTPAALAPLRGQRLRLSWTDDPRLSRLVRAVTTDIRLDAAARAASSDGNVVPLRLNGRRQVGPLQSLAGARPRDDITVELEEVEVAAAAGEAPSLRIGRPPIQTTGRWMALVRILGPAPAAAGGASSDRFRVQHYDRQRGAFSGPITTVRIPQQPPNRYGRWMSSPRGVASHPIGAQGWYLYGSPDATGLFTVQALRPRALFQLRTDRERRGLGAALRHLQRDNWSPASLQRGSYSRVELAPTAPLPWRLGDHGLVIHTFGGIGGPQAEPVPFFTVTGHFAFGEAEVVRDPFTGEPQFALHYHQIYANNPDGIVAGTQDWSAYAGDLRRGWLGTRPFSDLLVKLDLFDEPTGPGPRSGAQPLSLLLELQLQAEVLMARYRSGDGTGFNGVGAAISCVQDSSQALAIAVERLRQRLASVPRPGRSSGSLSSPETRRIAALDQLTHSLDGLLTPFGQMRADWRRNGALVDQAAQGSDQGAAFRRHTGLRETLLSWRTVLPRRGHDDLARLFLAHGAQLHVVRTNQIPGGDGRLAPLAPTGLLGQLPPVATLLRRIVDALFAPTGGWTVALTLLLLVPYALVALTLGYRSGFLNEQLRWGPPLPLLRRSLGWLLMPALLEELLFRVALLPHPLEGEGPWGTLAWGALGLGLFVIYHPLAERTWYPEARGVFHNPRFLVQCTLLGLVCISAYNLSGSLWPPLLIHWLVVTVWLGPLQGHRRLRAPR
ncbi:CPBP family intramembrane metalloprotease [Cyanobium sp. Morenito 9A2]|nr:CPBP family intramembrane metalloprotease [Cyanobium sp. Morenito 9A2]